VYAYYFFLFEEDDDELVERERLCRSGGIMCGECKRQLADRVKVFLTGFQEKRERARDVLGDYLMK
jgi:tryptophanyl-tRNA synthetase